MRNRSLFARPNVTKVVCAAGTFTLLTACGEERAAPLATSARQSLQAQAVQSDYFRFALDVSATLTLRPQKSLLPAEATRSVGNASAVRNLRSARIQYRLMFLDSAGVVTLDVLPPTMPVEKTAQGDEQLMLDWTRLERIRYRSGMQSPEITLKGGMVINHGLEAMALPGMAIQRADLPRSQMGRVITPEALRAVAYAFVRRADSTALATSPRSDVTQAWATTADGLQVLQSRERIVADSLRTTVQRYRLATSAVTIAGSPTLAK